MRAKKRLAMKRQVTHTSKTVCLDCMKYTCKNPNGQCNLCGSWAVVSMGTSFRLPSKNRVKDWKNIAKVYEAQLNRNLNNGNFDFIQYLRGFRNSGSSGQFGSKGLPKQFREKAFLEYIGKGF